MPLLSPTCPSHKIPFHRNPITPQGILRSMTAQETKVIMFVLVKLIWEDQ